MGYYNKPTIEADGQEILYDYVEQPAGYLLRRLEEVSYLQTIAGPDERATELARQAIHLSFEVGQRRDEVARALQPAAAQAMASL